MNAQFETLPRFSSIKEVEEWEQSLRKPERGLQVRKMIVGMLNESSVKETTSGLRS